MKPYRNRIVLLATVVVVCSVSARASKERVESVGLRNAKQSVGDPVPPSNRGQDARDTTPRGVTTNVTLWDTGAPLGDPINLTDRTAWKPVPPNLLMLEDDPQRALSSPAYYGREYVFQGDAVVENSYLTAVVRSAKGSVAVYSKADPSRKVTEFAPSQTQAKPAVGCAVLQNTGDEVALTVPSFAIVAFGQTAIIEIEPAENIKDRSGYESQ